MVVRISDKTQNYSKVTKLLVKPNFFSDSKKLNDLLSNCPSIFTNKNSIEDYLIHECIYF